MNSGAVEEKVDRNIGVQGSNPGRDYQFCEIFRMAKTDDSYVKIPMKTDQNDEKNVRALIGFGEVKGTKTDDFLCLNPKNFSTRVLIFYNQTFNLICLAMSLLTFLESSVDRPEELVSYQKCKELTSSYIS